MIKIDAAIRPALVGEAKAPSATGDAAGIAALFEGIIGQAIGTPGEDGSAQDGAVLTTAAASSPATTEPEATPVVETADAPAEAMAQQLLKALAGSVAGHTEAREFAKRGDASPSEAGDKQKSAKKSGKATDSADPVVEATPTLIQTAPAAPIAVAALPVAQTPAASHSPALQSIVQAPIVKSGVENPTPASTSSAIQTKPVRKADLKTLPASVSERPSGEGSERPQNRGSQELLRLVQQLAPAPARDIAHTILRKGDEGSDKSKPAIVAQATAPIAAADASLPSLPAVSPAAPVAQPAAAIVSQALPDHVERHLEVARDGAWLDQLARDIAQAGSDDGTSLRFRLHPAHLGSMHVEIARDAQGTSVRLTADTAAGRALLSDAQPKLIQEARAQGLRLSEAHVDLGGNGQGSPQRHTPAEPQIKTARLLHREEERDGKPTSGRAERYA